MHCAQALRLLVSAAQQQQQQRQQRKQGACVRQQQLMAVLMARAAVAIDLALEPAGEPSLLLHSALMLCFQTLL
jgi:hypothetical protein